MACRDPGLYCCLWDRTNRHQQYLVVTSDLQKKLTDNRVLLVQTLQLNALFWDYLLQLEVLTLENKETLKHNAPDREVCGRLLDYISAGPAWRFHAMLRACTQTHQNHVISEVLHLDPGDYDVEHDMPTDLQEAFREHCEACTRMLMRRPLFNFEDSSDHYVDTTKGFIMSKASMRDLKQMIREIEVDDIMRGLEKEDAPRTVILFGPAGAGKTTFTTNFVHSYCKRVCENLHGKPNLMVYIPAREIAGTVEEAIRNHLWCRDEHLDVLMHYVTTGEGVIIVLDALDEVHNREVMEKLRAYVKTRHVRKGRPAVLVSARTDQCFIEHSHFDRFLVLQGFTTEQGMDYVRKFSAMDQEHHRDLHQPFLGFVNRHREKLDAVLSNPLRLHVFCTLASRRFLNLQEEAGHFSIPNLFGTLEKYLISKHGTDVTEEQSQDFYRLCLYILLSGMRELPESLLTDFRISKSYYNFFCKEVRRGTNGAMLTYYPFSHEVILEYFASRSINVLSAEQIKALILYISCDRNRRNTQAILLELLSQEGEVELVKGMISSILILQYENSDHGDVKAKSSELQFIRNLADFPNKIKRDISIRTICRKHQEHQEDPGISRVTAVWSAVQEAIPNHASTLNKAKWFFYLERNGTLRHLVECRQMCGRQTDFILDSIIQLLPSEWTDEQRNHFTTYEVNSTRWAAISRESDTFNVHAWSLDDACEVLEKDAVRNGASRAEDKVMPTSMYLNTYQELWGPPPEATWSEDRWLGLLGTFNRYWRGQRVLLHLPESTPVGGLLTCLTNPHLELMPGGMDIWLGSLTLEELMTYQDRCKQAQVTFYLTYLTVLIPNNWKEEALEGLEWGTLRGLTEDDLRSKAEDVLKAKRDTLCRMKNCCGLRVLLDPQWSTEDGKAFCWSDR